MAAEGIPGANGPELGRASCEMTRSGIVYDIQRYSIHDGPGIRSNVFLKGAPALHGVTTPRGWLASRKSRSCGQCTFVAACTACPHGCHIVTAEGHRYDREACTCCGACAQACCFCALEVVGREMTAEEVVAEVERDRLFFETSGGGITLSGGEPLFQPASQKPS